MPSSLRRILASRANGARSQGPSTPQGKQRSSQNAIRHGLLARCIVLDKESRASFEALLTQHLDRLQPADGVEFGMVEEMVASYWRMRRAWAIETRLLEDAANAQGESDPVGSIAAAFTSLAASPALALMHRYETRLHLVYQRSLHNLLLLRTLAVRNEPNPISGQSDPVPLDPADAPTGNPAIAADPGIPFALIIAIVAIPVGFLVGNRGAMTEIGVSIAIALSYLGISNLFERIGDFSQLPPAMAAWAPDVRPPDTGGTAAPCDYSRMAWMRVRSSADSCRF